MGPEGLPTRPKFHWDLRNPPWTDGKGSQEQYYDAVKLWKSFHDNLPDGNSNKIPKSLQGLILQAQLFDRALDLVKKVNAEEIRSEDGALKVASAIYKQDVLSVVTDTFHHFLDLLRTKQGDSESFKNFESRFDAQVCKLNASCAGSELPSALVSFLLLANSRIDTAQRVSILSAATPVGLSIEEAGDSSRVLSAISYSDIATIVRACDEPRRPQQSNNRSLQGMSGLASGRGSKTERTKQRLTPAQFADLKSKSRCNRCRQLGHWASDRSKCPLCPESGKGLTPAQESQKGSKKPNVSSTGTLQFHMATMDTLSSLAYVPGPMVDDAAPYSALGFAEFKSLQKDIVPDWNGQLDDLPLPVRDKCYWQYGSGKHASPKRRILGSVFLSARTNQGSTIKICHLILEGSSPWVIGRNVTRLCDIRHIKSNCLEFYAPNGEIQTMSLVDVDDHSYLDASLFNHGPSDTHNTSTLDDTITSLTCYAHSANISWSDTKKVIEKVHRHVCGHASYRDIMLLLDRNEIWTEQCGKYLSHLMDHCANCKVVQLPTGSRKVSLRSMSRSFNDVVCIDHLFLEQHDVLHIMDAQTRYSAGLLVPTTSMRDAICAFESQWIFDFWPPHSVHGDKAFSNNEFRDYLKIYDVSFRLVPPRRHSKNVLESKHRVLRDIYLRLKSDKVTDDPRLLVSMMFRVSNDLYGNNYASSHELAKGYTRPVSHDGPRSLPLSIIKAQEKLAAKRKLNLILSSKSIRELPIHVGDFVQVYTRLQNQKRGTWSEPKPVLSINPDSRIVTVPGVSGRRRETSIEDVRFAVVDNALATEIQVANDLLSNDLDELLCQMSSDESADSISRKRSVRFEEYDDDNDSLMYNSDGQHDTSEYHDRNNYDQHDHYEDQGSNEHDEEGNSHDQQLEEAVGAGDATDALTYVPVQPSTFDPDDTSIETPSTSAVFQETPVTIAQSRWTQPPAPSVHQMQLRHRVTNEENEDDAMQSHTIELLPGTELTSSEQDALKQYHDRFQSKEFLLHHSEGLPSYIVENSYKEEEQSFIKQCMIIPRPEVPHDANVIRSHVLYKIKTRDDGTMTCKARIAPHGNEDRDKDQMKTDSACCPPLGMRILFSLCVIFQWYLTKIDVKGAFLQSGQATRDVYVVPPKECEEKRFIWLLTAATYGLVNANAKWQLHSDNTILDLGLSSLVYVPQLFYLCKNDMLTLVLIKVTDDIFIAGDEQVKRKFIKRLSSVYELGTITHLPGVCWFFGLEICQAKDYTIQVHADAKLSKLVPYSLSRTRRKDYDSVLNAVEAFHYNSLNGSIGFIGVHAQPIASFVSSYLQQKRNSVTVHDLALQSSLIKSLKRLGSITTYCCPASGTFHLSVLLFADAARPSGHGQLGMICGLLIGNLDEGSLFHILSWCSQLSKRPAKSIGSAEILAAGIAIHEGILVSSSLSCLLNTVVPVVVAIDSKDLFDSLTSCHVPEDKSIRADVQLIRYYFETKKIHRIIWLPGSLNLADPLTKKNSVLTDCLQLLLFEGRLPFGFETSQSRTSEPNLG